MELSPPTLIHATAVALPIGADWVGVLLRGPSGSGKSDLALRLIDGGARLVADDQTEVTLKGGAPVLRPPARLAGHIEVRGLGIVPVPSLDSAPLVLVADLVAPHEVERLPALQSTLLAGQPVPSIRIAPFEASAPAKLRLAADLAMRNRLATVEMAVLS